MPHRTVVLGRAPGLVVTLLDLGATVQQVHVTDGDGERRNVVLGHRTPQEQLTGADYLGSVVGRYANRIAGGCFTVDGASHEVRRNDRGNALHGGPDGFDRRRWELVELDGRASVTWRLVSPDGDQGYPGEVTALARYAVGVDSLRLDLEARTTRPCPVNLTSHVYLNLDGEGAGSVDDHLLQVEADAYLPVDGTGIPLGGPAPVEGTPFDLRKPTPIGAAERRDHAQTRAGRGLDHNLVLRGAAGTLRPVARLSSPRSGLGVELSCDQPGLQVYSGGFLDGTVAGTSGRLYRQGDGVALEPQHWPDSPNRRDFPDTVLRPGQVYRSATVWRFSA